MQNLIEDSNGYMDMIGMLEEEIRPLNSAEKGYQNYLTKKAAKENKHKKEADDFEEKVECPKCHQKVRKSYISGKGWCEDCSGTPGF